MLVVQCMKKSKLCKCFNFGQYKNLTNSFFNDYKQTNYSLNMFSNFLSFAVKNLSNHSYQYTSHFFSHTVFDLTPS